MLLIPYSPAGSLGITENLEPETASPWDQPKRWGYGDASQDEGITHRGVENPLQVPPGVVDPRDYFRRKTDEDTIKRTPAGGTWHPAKSDPIWHGSDRAGADPSKWFRGGAAQLRRVNHEQ